MESIIVKSENEVDFIILQKMKFIYNAIIDGWSVKKIKNQFIFTKKHEGKKEVHLDNYIDNFIKTNLNNNL